MAVLHIEDLVLRCTELELAAYIQGLLLLAQAKGEPVGMVQPEAELHIVVDMRGSLSLARAREEPVAEAQ